MLPKPSKLLVYLTLSACTLGFSSASLAQCNSEEVGFVATFQVKAGSESAFEAVLSELAETVNRVETGVLLYAPYKAADGQYFMMERYVNLAAREAHGKDPAVAALFPNFGEHLAAAPVVTPVSAVCP